MKPCSKHPVPYPVSWLEPGRESQGLEGDEEGKLLGGAVRLSGFGNEGDWLGLGSCPVRFEGDKGWVAVGDHGKIVTSDPATEAFIGDPEADAMRTRPRRAPWNA